MTRTNGRGQTLTTGLTWFSVGLGIAQLVAPGRMTKLIGTRNTDDARSLVRLIGVRETVAGIGLLSGTKPDAWLGGRIGGDLIDLALLVGAMRQRGTNRSRLLAATGAVLGITALDIFGAVQAARAAAQPHNPTSSGRKTPTTKTIVVNRDPEDVYQFWSNFENFPKFMNNLESVTTTGNGRSHWKALGPAGKRFEWDAEIVENRPHELIRWRSLPGADVDNDGSVRFERAPGGRGTLVRVNLRYDLPGGIFGTALATLTGSEPGQEVSEDLRRFKQVMETGEVVRSDASIHPTMHNARPPEQPIPLRDSFHIDVPARRQTHTWQEARERLESADPMSGQSGETRAPARSDAADRGAALTPGGAP